MSQRSILVIDGDCGATSQVSEIISAHGYVVDHKLELPINIGSDSPPALIVFSVVESGMAGLDLLNAILSSSIPAIVLVAPDQIRIAVEAFRLGASDVLIAPVDSKDLLSAIEIILKKHRSEESVPAGLERSRLANVESLTLLSRSEKMKQIWDVARRVARTDLPVLILGESGVGKEVLAHVIHRQSSRARKPLVKVNCAALPPDLLESELFGYERGAFTGAVGEKPGRFELADKGCIILDEIGEMTPNLQAKLLHVLEDGEYSRLGGKRPIKVDVRVLALTNRRLEEALPRGEFRGDLYFRLNVIKIEIPPLRERKEDIPLLCDYFVKTHRNILGSSVEELPPYLMDIFTRYDWPGNIRQLENATKRYLILPELDLGLGTTTSVPEAQPSPELNLPRAHAEAAIGIAQIFAFPGSNDVSLKTVVSRAAEYAERELILQVLEQTNWNRSEAARRLHICYKGLLNKLKKWRIEKRHTA